jgi:hypothetical protein
MCERLCGFADAGISGDSTKLSQFTASINRAYGSVISWIFKVDGRWHWDDSNQTDFPISTTTLIANQRDYTLPAALLHIRQVEILNTAGDYYTLDFMSDDDYRLRNNKEQEDAGIPTHYYLLGNSVFIYPKTTSSFATLSAGIRLTYDRYADYFTTADTTQAPGFAEPFHKILAYIASAEYCLSNDMPRQNTLEMEVYGSSIKRGLKYDLESYYSLRNNEDRKIISSSLRRSMFN